MGQEVKVGHLVLVSSEVAEDAYALRGPIDLYFAASPEQRAEWATEAKDKRAEERLQAEHVPLTLVAVLDRLGFSTEFAAHLVQPYCTCSVGSDGWDFCQHAYDLGLV